MDLRLRISRVFFVGVIALVLSVGLEGAELSEGEAMLRFRSTEVSSLRVSDLFQGAALVPGTSVYKVDLETGAAEASTYLFEWLPNFWIRSGDWLVIDSSASIRLQRTDVHTGRIPLLDPRHTLELVTRTRTNVGGLAYIGIFDESPQDGTIVIVSKESATTSLFPRPPVDARGEFSLDRTNLRAFVRENGSWVPAPPLKGSRSTNAQLNEFERVWIYRPDDAGLEPVKPEPTIVIKRDGRQLVIEYVGTLLAAPELWGPYEVVEGAVSPYTIDANRSVQFFVAD